MQIFRDGECVPRTEVERFRGSVTISLPFSVLFFTSRLGYSFRLLEARDMVQEQKAVCKSLEDR